MMKKYKNSLIFFVFVIFSLPLSSQHKSIKNQYGTIEEFLSWFNGEFDNFQQVFAEKEEKASEPHEHIHSVFKSVELPWLGKHVIYVYQYMDGDTLKVYRQRLYRFEEYKSEKAIRLEIFSFKNDTPYYFSHLNLDKLKNLTAADIQSAKGCEVYWKKTEDYYVGYMKPNSCKVVSKKSGKTLYITDSLRLSAKEIWIRDEAFDSAGQRVFGRIDRVHHKLKRCEFYTGWMVLQKAGFENEYHVMRGLVWHNQGKRHRLVTEDGKPTKYELELATVVYNKNLEVLKLALYESGSSKAIAYTWASPQSKNIGLNLRWFQAGLTKME
ncbi:MAG: chromophore lyase CpcT/CpeT [Chitinophagaceae bacterium]|nr:chromophore lyase CpcT/CpeT [Chitinophagaceae bacterium]